ncbi:hypothetical protein THAOC_28516 [Thalassiosira oceanica]|uniref:Uncharacterized protein n=1 Tax=Thalassiosira oceanica TaxID=159749 RepID=K0RJ03_THAOC|nr:hypothetical protein THAOC_28516 [Thalassiosira oceanica]|eukprot:EJK52239.1 hypothetical protein THAOC_28516 [Thalassiosira oceanica]
MSTANECGFGRNHGRTNKQTNGQRARVYEKNAQGVKSSSSSSLALVLDSSRAEACTASNKQGHKLVWDRGLQCGILLKGCDICENLVYLVQQQNELEE